MNQVKTRNIFIPVLAVIFTLIIILIMGSDPNKEVEPLYRADPVKYRSVLIPDTVSFAGEPVPVSRFDVRESLDRELLVNSYFHSQTLRLIKLAPRYFSVIEPLLKLKGVPDDFKYLAAAESILNPRAVSPAGAVGIWQFLRVTGKEYGLEINNEVDERYHLEKSTIAACDFLLAAYSKYGRWSMVAASYNAGMSGVEKQMERQKSNSYYDILLNEETGRYLYRIIALKLILEDPGSYNFIVREDEKYPVIPIREIKISGKIANFADFALENGINYKLLKDFNPWLRDNFLTNPHNKTYNVQIPVL
jgi:hypothetical protein